MIIIHINFTIYIGMFFFIKVLKSDKNVIIYKLMCNFADEKSV